MKLKTLMMNVAVSALIAGGAVAQTATTDTTAPDAAATDVAPAAPQFNSISEMTVGDLVGKNVYDPNGDTIGDIDYVIDRDGSGTAVIGVGGFLGLGEYTVALPLEDFDYDASQQMVTLDTTKDALKEQPEFDESEIESLPDETPLADLVADTDDSGMTDDATATDDMSTTGDAATDMSDDSATGATDDSATDMSDDSATGATDDSATSDDPAMTEEPATDDAGASDAGGDSAATGDDAAADPAMDSEPATDEGTVEEETKTE